MHVEPFNLNGDDPARYDGRRPEPPYPTQDDKIAQLYAVLHRIQELATDTPTKSDMETALNEIVRECEDALSA